MALCHTYRSTFILFVFCACVLISDTSVAHAQTTPSVCPFTWDRDLKAGSVGDDVRALQQFLNSAPDTQVSTTGTGSIGNESNRFGTRTAQAVVRFQEKYRADILVPLNLTKGNGRVGVATRAKLNALCGVSPATSALSASSTIASATTSAPTLVVAEAPAPSPSLAPAWALRVPFSSFTAEARDGDVTINTITVTLVGPAHRKAFSTVSLLDEDGYVVTYGYFNSNNQVILKDPIDIAQGETRRFVVAGDMDDTTEYDQQIAGLNVTAIEATTPIAGTFPLRGTFHTINSTLVIGSVTTELSPNDPNAERTFYINDTGITFSAIRLTASAEDVVLKYISWEQNGSAGPDDVKNIATVVNGQSYPAEADGKWYTSTFTEPIIIHKGDTIDLQVVGDLTVTGSNRTVRFDIHWPDDIFVDGKTYGLGIYPAASGNTATEGNSVFLTLDGTTDTLSAVPFFRGSVVNISHGAFIQVSK